MRAQEQGQSRVFYELCSMIIQILKVPSLPVPIRNPYVASTSSSASSSSSSSGFPVATLAQVSPTAFASLFIGISLALMLFGTVTFVIGFILMPWVFGLVLLFYVAGILSTLSDFGKSLLDPPSARHAPDMNTNCYEKNSDETKEDDCVDKDRDAACLHVCKLHHSFVPRELKQQPWSEEHEQNHSYYYRTPICHFCCFFQELPLCYAAV
ncbi:hypothetical protein Tsubulata_035746 [Turnera subulata]|uniref:Uncharacterized protein n=1 Tax=Turnera subulata TaxID=218843 RepID=A0A9Q0FH11_9ROSI|nr:hypothetical protein Tsubulata_035746 [Turnera subulata]